jgi:hypothetical protein
MIEASVASVASVVVVGPAATVPTRFGATLRFVLPRRPMSVLWAVAAVGHHNPTHQHHWEYCMSVRPSEN